MIRLENLLYIMSAAGIKESFNAEFYYRLVDIEKHVKKFLQLEYCWKSQ